MTNKYEVLTPPNNVMITDYLSNETILVLLAAFGYWMASGAVRANYRLLHVALGITIFFVLGLVTYYAIEQRFDIYFNWGIVGAFAVVIIIAYLWKRWIADWVFHFLRDWGITSTSFGPAGAWDNFASIPGRDFRYYHIYLKNGDRLSSNAHDLAFKRQKNELDFDPEVIIDEQGNIILMVTKIRTEVEGEEKKIKETKTKKVVDEGRTKFTYIPASNIEKIEVFIKPKRKCCLF